MKTNTLFNKFNYLFSSIGIIPSLLFLLLLSTNAVACFNNKIISICYYTKSSKFHSKPIRIQEFRNSENHYNTSTGNNYLFLKQICFEAPK